MVSPVIIDQDNYLTFINKVNAIITEIGDLSSLTTTNKTSLVNAINELDLDTSYFVKKTNNAGANGALTQSLLTNYIFGGDSVSFSGSTALQIDGTLRIGSTGSNIDTRNAYLSLGNPTSGSPFGNAGLLVKRGTGLQDSKIFWDETSLEWRLDNSTQVNQKLFHSGNVNNYALDYLQTGNLISDNFDVISSAPYLELNKTSASLDAKKWRIKPSASGTSGDFAISTIKDDNSLEVPAYIISRTNNLATKHDFLLNGISYFDVTSSLTRIKTILNVDNIQELTSANGISVEGMKIKDDYIGLGNNNHLSFKTSGTLFNEGFLNLDFSVNDDFGLAFFVDASEATINSKKLHNFENNIKVNGITEFTSDNGVVIEGMNFKDGVAYITDFSSFGSFYFDLDNDNNATNQGFNIRDNGIPKFNLNDSGQLTVYRNTGGTGVRLWNHNASTNAEANIIIDFYRSASVGGTGSLLGSFGYAVSGNTNLTINNNVGNIGYNADAHIFNNPVFATSFTGNHLGTINGVSVSNFWHSGNDGSGSGLDADLLDGIQSLQFLRSDESDVMNGLLQISNPNAEQLRIGYATGAIRNSYISIYNGLTTRIGYIQGDTNSLNLVSDFGASIALYGSGVATLNNKNLVVEENISWTPQIFDGDGTQFSYTDANFSAYRIGNIVYVSFEGFISGTMSNDNPYVILPVSVPFITNLGNCWTNSLSDPDGNYGTVGVQDHGCMIARSNRAYFRNAGYGYVNGNLLDEYLVFSFSYKV